MRLYITHCCAKKDAFLRNTGKKVAPEKLYSAIPLQRFIKKCKEKKARWAIFSDKYDVWFPSEKHEWYEKHPNNVSEQEFKRLVRDLKKSLVTITRFTFTMTLDAFTLYTENC